MAVERIASDKTFIEEILEVTKKHCLEWCEIVKTLGMDTKTITKWRTTFKDSQEDVFQDLIGQALQFQKRLIENIEQLLRKAEELCKTLNLEMPQYGSEELSLFEEKERLQKQVEEYELQIKKKRQEIDALEKRHIEVCQSLGIETHHKFKSSLPTEEEISALLQKVESLEEEKFRREETYLQLKDKLIPIVTELGIKPSLNIEKIVFSDNISLFVLSDSNMKWLEEYHESLLNQQNQLKTEITEKWEKLHNLWDLLQEDIQIRSQFSKKHVGNSLHVLEALKAEVKRCKDLKAVNIQKFITNLRSQMQELWKKCHFSAEQRNNFEYFHITCYTEDLLTLHDIEVNKLKKYYNENKEILSLLEKRQQLWERMLNLEERSTVPDRFKNRGGQLLKEEKERNILHKNIPELETRIFQLAEEYAERTGNVFISNGFTVQELISKSYDTHNQEKKLKLSARKQQRELITTPSKSRLNPTISSTNKIPRTPGPSPCNVKRKLQVALFSDAKRTKESAGLKSAPSKLQVNSRTVQSRHSYERKKRLQKIRRISNSKVKRIAVASDSSSNTTYRDFEQEMASKQMCRSTFHVDLSSDILAVHLPATPHTPKLCNTPKSLKKKLKGNNETPRAGLKLKPSQSKLEF